MYYACLRVKRTKKDKDGPETIIRKAFADRDEARAYISSILNNEEELKKYDQLWTE